MTFRGKQRIHPLLRVEGRNAYGLIHHSIYQRVILSINASAGAHRRGHISRRRNDEYRRGLLPYQPLFSYTQGSRRSDKMSMRAAWLVITLQGAVDTTRNGYGQGKGSRPEYQKGEPVRVRPRILEDICPTEPSEINRSGFTSFDGGVGRAPNQSPQAAWDAGSFVSRGPKGSVFIMPNIPSEYTGAGWGIRPCGLNLGVWAAWWCCRAEPSTILVTYWGITSPRTRKSGTDCLHTPFANKGARVYPYRKDGLPTMLTTVFQHPRP